jgi:hypothetical protein
LAPGHAFSGEESCIPSPTYLTVWPPDNSDARIVDWRAADLDFFHSLAAVFPVAQASRITTKPR